MATYRMVRLALGLVCCARLLGCNGEDPAIDAGPMIDAGPAAVDEALARFNLTEEDGRVVFYDNNDARADLSAGHGIAPDDLREIWRFSVPLDRLRDDRDRTPVDLADPAIEVMLRLRDLRCSPEDACAMVTLTRGADASFSVHGRADVVVRDDRPVGMYFDLTSDFTLPSGLYGSKTYGGGAFPIDRERAPASAAEPAPR